MSATPDMPPLSSTDAAPPDVPGAPAPTPTNPYSDVNQTKPLALDASLAEAAHVEETFVEETPEGAFRDEMDEKLQRQPKDESTAHYKMSDLEERQVEFRDPEPLTDPRDKRLAPDDIGGLDQNRDKFTITQAIGRDFTSAVIDYVAAEDMGTLFELFEADQGGDDNMQDNEELDDEEEHEYSIQKQKALACSDNNSISITFVINQLTERHHRNRLGRDLCLYFPFMVLFFYFFYGGKDTEGAFYIAQGYENLLMGNEMPSQHPYRSYVGSGYVWPPTAAGLEAGFQTGPMYDKAYLDLDAGEDFHDWFEGVCVPYLWGRTNEWRTSQSVGTPVPIGTGSNILLGSLRVRAYLMPNDSCTSEPAVVPRSTDIDFMKPDAQVNYRCTRPGTVKLLRSAPATDPGAWPGFNTITNEHDCRLLCNSHSQCTASVFRTQPPIECEVFNETCQPQYELPNVTGRAEYLLRLRDNERKPYPGAGVCYGEFSSEILSRMVDSFGPIGDTGRFRKYQCPSPSSRWISGKVRQTRYRCGGYIFDIPFSYSFDDAITEAFKLRGDPNRTAYPDAPQVGMIDDGSSTRYIVAEFHSYTVSLNYFMSIKLYTEVSPGGSWVPNSQIRTYRIFRPPSDTPMLIFDCVFMLIVAILYGKFIQEWKDFAEDTRNAGRLSHGHGQSCGGKTGVAAVQFILNPWNIVEFVNLNIFIVVFGYRIAWWVKSMSVNYRVPTPGYPEDLDDVAYLFLQSVYFNSVNSIFCFLKVLKYVELNDRFNILSRTAGAAMQNLLGILLIFMIVLFAYSVTGASLFGNGVEDYRSLAVAFDSSLRVLLGDFDYDTLREENLILTGIYFWTFIILASYLLLNFIIAVISDAFDTEMSKTFAPPLGDMLERIWDGWKNKFINQMDPKRFKENWLCCFKPCCRDWFPEEEYEPQLNGTLVRDLCEKWLVEEVGKVSGKLFPDIVPSSTTNVDADAQAEESDKRAKWGDNEYGYLNNRIGSDSILREKYSITFNDLKKEIIEKLWLGPSEQVDAENVEKTEKATNPDDPDTARRRMIVDELYTCEPHSKFFAESEKCMLGEGVLKHVLGEGARGIGPRPVTIVDKDDALHLLQIDYGETHTVREGSAAPRKGTLQYFGSFDQDEPIELVPNGKIIYDDNTDVKSLILLRGAEHDEEEVGRIPLAEKDLFPRRNLVTILRRVLNLCVGPLGGRIVYTSTNPQYCHCKMDPIRSLLTPDLTHSYQRVQERDILYLQRLWWELTLEKSLKGDEVEGDALQKERAKLRVAAVKAMQDLLGTQSQKEFKVKELLQDLASPDDAERERRRRVRAEEEAKRKEAKQKHATQLLNLMRPSQRMSESIQAILSRVQDSQESLRRVCDLVLHLDVWLTNIYKTFRRPQHHTSTPLQHVKVRRPTDPEVVSHLTELLRLDGVPYAVMERNETSGVATSELLTLSIHSGACLKEGDTVVISNPMRPQKVDFEGTDVTTQCPVWYPAVLTSAGSKGNQERPDSPWGPAPGSPWAGDAAAGDRRGSIDSVASDAIDYENKDDIFICSHYLVGMDNDQHHDHIYRLPENKERLPPRDWDGRFRQQAQHY